MRSFVQLFRSATKGVWLDADATEGAVVGENLFVRMDDGTLALFQPTEGTVIDTGGATPVRLALPTSRSGARRAMPAGRSVTPASGSAMARSLALARRSLGFAGSNSGYAPGYSPATPQSGFDLDPQMIAGLPPALNPYPIVPQLGHGFTVGTLVRLNGSNYVGAKADTAINAEVVGMVATVEDANNFRICCGGRVTGLAGLVAGSVYFLSATTAGTMSLTDPMAGGVVGQVSKPVFIADSATSGYFINMRGEVIVAGGIAPGGAWNTVIKNADESRANTITYANDSQLLTPSLPVGVYTIRLFLQNLTANATMKAKFQLAFSGTGTFGTGYRRFNNDAVTAPFDTVLTPGAVLVSQAPGGTMTAQCYWEVRTTLTVTVAGVLSVQWAQQVSNAGNCTIQAGSMLEYAKAP